MMMLKRWLCCGLLLVLPGCASNTKPQKAAAASNVPKSCDTLSSCKVLLMLKIKSNILFDKALENNNVKVYFHLDEKANVVEFKVLEGQQHPLVLAAVKDAVYRASPFVELLAMTPEDFAEVQDVTVDYTPECD